MGVGGIGFYLWQARNWVNSYEVTHLGFTETQVVKLLGSPTRTTEGTEWVEQDPDQARLKSGPTDKFLR